MGLTIAVESSIKNQEFSLRLNDRISSNLFWKVNKDQYWWHVQVVWFHMLNLYC